MTLFERALDAVFGPVIQRRVAAHLASVAVRVDDSTGWVHHGDGPLERDLAERLHDLDDALEAWRKNFMIRRIVTLTQGYVVGGGITLSSDDPQLDTFIRAFWHHPKNRLSTRLDDICDELTRSGEIFPILWTNRFDGMSYVRFVPASQILSITTDPNDYEHELAYTEIGLEGKTWYHPHHPKSRLRYRGHLRRQLPPTMLHYTVNRPIGAVRGESDLTPILPWAKRYSEWLKDRAKLNRIRTRTAMLDIEVKEEGKVAEVRERVRTENPLVAGAYVHGPGQEVQLLTLNIGADDAKEDGHALRLAIATGANLGLHFLGEGESVNYATAKEMGEPTTRFYAKRQQVLIAHLTDLVAHAYRRYCTVRALPLPDNLEQRITATAAEVARADNESLAQAARAIVETLAQMKAEGWVSDHEAVRIAYKFAGEPIGAEEIDRILNPEGGPHDPD